MPSGVYTRSDKEKERLRSMVEQIRIIPPKGKSFSVSTQFKKGSPPWNKGQKWPEISGDNHPSRQPEHKEKFSKLLDGHRYKATGPNHHQWKGGKTPLIQKLRNCQQYAEWRTKVFEHDHYACFVCGDDRGRNLEAHHVKQFAAIIHRNNITTFQQGLQDTELWDTKNGVTVCETCHPVANEISRIVNVISAT